MIAIKWLVNLIIPYFAAFHFQIKHSSINAESQNNATAMLRSVQLKEWLKSSCPLVNSVDLPLDSDLDQITVVTVSMNLNRLKEMSDLDMRMNVMASLQFQWNISCVCWGYFAWDGCSNSEFDNQPSEEFDWIYFVSFDQKDIWHPMIIHVNAYADLFSVEKYGSTVDLMWETTALWNSNGEYETICNYKLGNFPFDEQQCDFIFQSWIPLKNLRLDYKHFKVSSDFVDDSDIWEVTNTSAENFQTFKPLYNDPFSAVKFTVRLKRKSFCYASSLFVPTFSMTALEMLSLIMPPHMPDRSAFSMTVLLATTILLTIVQDQIPQTAEVVYIVWYILGQMVIGILLTIYSLVMCSYTDGRLLHRRKSTVEKDFQKCRISPERIADIIAFTVSLLIFIVLTIFVVSQLLL